MKYRTWHISDLFEMRRKSAWQIIVLGLFFMILGLLPIFFPKFNVKEAIKKNQWPEKIPPNLYEFRDQKLKNRVAVNGNSNDEVTIFFPEMETLLGFWKGQNSHFEVTQPFNRLIPASSGSNDWGNRISYKQDFSGNQRSFKPWIKFTFDHLKDYIGYWITGEAYVEIVYPYTSGVKEFKIKRNSLKIVHKFYVSDDFTVKQLENYQKMKENKSVLFVFLGIFIFGVLIILIGVIGLRVNRY